MQTRTHDLTFTADEVHKRFVHWDRGEADREWDCLVVLAEHAPGLAPRPLRRETRDGAPVVVMERLAGEPLGDEPLTDAQTTSLGRALRRMYDVPQETLRLSGLGARRYGPAGHRERVTEWLGEPYDLSPCADPRLVSRAKDAALQWLADPDNLPEPRLVALGIADLNPANILWDGETCRLVDFEDGGLTDPSYDLADHVEHIGSRLPGILDAEALMDAVGLGEEERERAARYRPLWSAFWLAMLLPGNGGFHRNPPGTTEWQAEHLLAQLG